MRDVRHRRRSAWIRQLPSIRSRFPVRAFCGRRLPYEVPTAVRSVPRVSLLSSGFVVCRPPEDVTSLVEREAEDAFVEDYRRFGCLPSSSSVIKLLALNTQPVSHSAGLPRRCRLFFELEWWLLECLSALFQLRTPPSADFCSQRFPNRFVDVDALLFEYVLKILFSKVLLNVSTEALRSFLKGYSVTIVYSPLPANPPTHFDNRRTLCRQTLIRNQQPHRYE